MSFPFFKGVTDSTSLMQKTHKIIYGKRRFDRHRPTNEATEKPKVETLLLKSPNNKIDQIIRNAHMAKEIDGMNISYALKQLRQINRYDKGLAICRAYERIVGRKLKASHFVSLMTLALHAPEKLEDGGKAPLGGWQESLRIFQAGFIKRRHENPLSSASIGAAFSALNAGGKWEQSSELFASAVKDRIQLEPRAVHTLISHLRRQNKWHLALRAFDTSVKQTGTNPDYLMYRELLYTIKESAFLSPENASTAWSSALSVASAIYNVCPPNAGIYNVLIETCAISRSATEKRKMYDPKTKKFYKVSAANSNNNKNNKDAEDMDIVTSASSSSGSRRSKNFVSNQWEAGIRVFQHLQDRVVLSAVTDASNRTIVNAHTIEALSSLRPTNAEFQIQCVNLSRQYGLDIPQSVFRRLFVSLDLAERSEEGLAFAQKYLDDAVNDTGNFGLGLLPMLTGLLDSLTNHPEIEIAQVTANHFKSNLQPVLASATVGCGVWGDESQSWIVESGAKVAVIDAGVLMSASSTDMHVTLLSQFDAIIVPFTAVRSALRKLDREPNTSLSAMKLLKSLDLLRHLQVLEAPPRNSGDTEDNDINEVTGGAGPVQVLPFVHHLKALQYLSSSATAGGTTTTSSTQEFSLDNGNELIETDEKQSSKLLDTKESGRSTTKKNSAPKFISAAAPSSSSSTLIPELDSIVSLRDENDQRQFNAMMSSSDALVTSARSGQLQKQQQEGLQPFWIHQRKSSNGENNNNTSSSSFRSPSYYGWSHPVGTALMLSRLNPDATITVVHSNNDQVRRCAEYYGCPNVENYFDLHRRFTRGDRTTTSSTEEQRRTESLRRKLFDENDENDDGGAVEEQKEEEIISDPAADNNKIDNSKETVAGEEEADDFFTTAAVAAPDLDEKMENEKEKNETKSKPSSVQQKKQKNKKNKAAKN